MCVWCRNLGILETVSSWNEEKEDNEEDKDKEEKEEEEEGEMPMKKCEAQFLNITSLMLTVFMFNALQLMLLKGNLNICFLLSLL